jgi:hypothetical protein
LSGTYRSWQLLDETFMKEFRRRIIPWLVVFSCAARLPAQAPPATAEEPDSGRPQPTADSGASYGSSVVERMFLGENTYGLSLGFSRNWDSNPSYIDNGQVSDSYSLLYPRFFANLQRGRIYLGLDYLPTLRWYRNYTGLSPLDHRGDFQFRLHVSPHVSWFASESVAYSPYEPEVLLDRPLVRTRPADLYAPRIFFQRERLLTNDVSTGLSYQFSPRNAVVVQSGYSVQRFPRHPIDDGDTVQGSVDFSRELDSRLTAFSRYGYQQFRFHQGRTHMNLHGINVGLRYVLNRGFSVSGALGNQFFHTETAGRSHDVAANAGIQYSRGRTSAELNYTKAVTTPLGVTSSALRSNIFSSSIYRTLTSRAAVGFRTVLSRHENLGGSTPLWTGSASPEVNVLLRHDLVMSLTYTYLKQNENAQIENVPGFAHHHVSLGLEYRPWFLRSP